MPPFPQSPLVSTGWLADRLGSSDLVILDTSWYLPVSGRVGIEEYLAGHIPGARYFDLDQASDPGSSLPHMLPSEARFAEYVGGLGVSTGSPVVVYDGSGANLSAARVWWMFREFGHDAVWLLDGGFRKWLAEDRNVESGPRVRRPAAFSARRVRSGVCRLAEVLAALTSGEAQVVDARSAGRFAGLEPEPRAGLPSGHMPGSLNLPYTELVNPDGTALSLEQLQRRVRAAGISLDHPVIATCGSGVSACNILLALYRLGHHAASLYDGSWTEWASQQSPVASGPG